jgi:hypothetical protein
MAAIIQPFERTARFAFFGAKTSVGLSSIAVSADPSDRRVVAVDANSAVHSFRWPPPYGRAPQVASARRHCLTQLPASDASKTSCLAIVPAPDNPRAMHVLSGGHFDGALCVADESGRTRVIQEDSRFSSGGARSRGEGRPWNCSSGRSERAPRRRGYPA